MLYLIVLMLISALTIEIFAHDDYESRAVSWTLCIIAIILILLS